jgi:hypothetical protein
MEGVAISSSTGDDDDFGTGDYDNIIVIDEDDDVAALWER